MDTALHPLHPIHHGRRRIRYREPLIHRLAPLLLTLTPALLLTGLLVSGRETSGVATALRWLALLGYGAAGFALARVLRRLRLPGYVELQEEALVLPGPSLTNRLLQIPYGSIHGLSVAHIDGEDVLVLRSSLGESRLRARGFPCRRDFDTFTASIRRRIRGQGGH